LNLFEYIYLGNQERDGQKVELYRFRNLFNDVVMVEIFHYDFNVYAIKFFLKKHSLSDRRYNLTYPIKFKTRRKSITGNKNFFMVLNTLLKISLDISKKDNLASFGFLGAPKEKELDVTLNGNNINTDNTVKNTVRFRTYYLYVKRHFNPETFEYIVSESSSILLLRNNRNKNTLSKDRAEKFILNDVLPNLC